MLAGIALVLAGGLGAAVLGHPLPGALLVLSAVSTLLALQSWRWPLYGLLAYLPVSGLAIIAFYGDRSERAAAVLLKDFAFVIPAYVGFLVWAAFRPRRVLYPGAPVTVLVLLAALVLVQTLNPALPSLLVAMIGAKVWLFYVPLLFLGYHLVRDERDLFRVLGLMSLVAIVPATVGLVEAALIYGGKSDAVYRLYGDAAAAATQNFVEFEFAGGGTLRRVPSTFSFVVQYYTFLATMVAVVYAWWRGRHARRALSVPAGVLWLSIVLAAFLTGQRAAFVFVPGLIALILVLERRQLRLQYLGLAAAPLALALAVVAFLGASPVAVASNLVETARLEFGDAVVHGVEASAETTVIGVGTGMNTAASRYAYAHDQSFGAIEGKWHEGWYVKAWLELGLVGLALVLVLFATILWRGLQAHSRLRNPRLRVVSAALIAFLAWTMVYGIKGQYADLDPLNVYFWLFAGFLARIPTLDESAAAEPTAAEPR